MSKQSDFLIRTKNFPDLGGIFSQLKIRDRLGLVSDNTILGYAILLALEKKTPLSIILNNIMDAYKDNPDGTLRVVGEETMGMIIQLLSKAKSHA